MDESRINQAVGAELRAARARQDWTREQLAEASGVPAVSIRRYESGARSIPVATLVALVTALKISISDIDKAIQAAAESDPVPVDRASAGRKMRAKARERP